MNELLDLRPKGSLLATKNKGRPDNFQTPSWPVQLLLDTIQVKTWEQCTFWDPCRGKGNIEKVIRSNGHLSVGTDIDMGFDFLNLKVEPKFDAIITNPPYSLKDEFLAKCYELGKPFALLLPLSALEGKKRQPLYKKYGMQLCLLPRRVNFETPNNVKKSSCHFSTAWFTNGFGFGKDINYL